MKKRVTYKSKTVCLPDSNNLPKPCYADVVSHFTPGPEPEPELRCISVHCAVEDVQITINGIERSTALLLRGSSYEYTVSKPGYNTITGSGILTEDAVFRILGISGPTNFDTKLNDTDFSNLFVFPGTSVSYIISKPGYVTPQGEASIRGTKMVTADTVLNAHALAVTITPTPDFLEINGYNNINGIMFEEGDTVSYDIYAGKDGYNNLYLDGTTDTDLDISDSLPDLTPLCFESLKANSSIQYIIIGSGGPYDIKYSTDLETWTQLNANTRVNLPNIGDKIYFKGSNARLGVDFSNYFRFTGIGNFACNGNVNSLLDNGDGSTITSVPDFCYYYLFIGLSITTAPILSATSVGERSYAEMFNACRQLKYAPKLPATVLGTACYMDMFSNCSGLTSLPDLPATTLALNCYDSMFYACTAITKSVELPALTLEQRCYAYMFDDCTALTEIKPIHATTFAPLCFENMFGSCRSLEIIPNGTFQDAQMEDYCFQHTFQNCTKLRDASSITISSSARECCWQMFSYCPSLTEPPQLTATTLAPGCYKDMFSKNCSLQKAPIIHATTLANSCFDSMFVGCFSLSEVKLAYTGNFSSDNFAHWMQGGPERNVLFLATNYGCSGNGHGSFTGGPGAYIRTTFTPSINLSYGGTIRLCYTHNTNPNAVNTIIGQTTSGENLSLIVNSSGQLYLNIPSPGSPIVDNEYLNLNVEQGVTYYFMLDVVKHSVTNWMIYFKCKTRETDDYATTWSKDVYTAIWHNTPIALLGSSLQPDTEYNTGTLNLAKCSFTYVDVTTILYNDRPAGMLYYSGTDTTIGADAIPTGWTVRHFG